jgi:hypothetical protein
MVAMGIRNPVVCFKLIYIYFLFEIHCHPGDVIISKHDKSRFILEKPLRRSGSCEPLLAST